MWFFSRKRKMEALLRLMGLQEKNLEQALVVATDIERQRRACQDDKNGYFGNFQEGGTVVAGMNYEFTQVWNDARRKIEALRQEPPDQNIFCDPYLLHHPLR